MTWLANELKSINLGHKARDKRFQKIVESFLSVPNGSIPNVGPGWYNTKAIYEFFKIESISDQDLLTPHFNSVQLRARQHSRVLIAHDTTECIFGVDAEGLGYINDKTTKGILSHNSLVITPEGQPLGLIAQYNWTRPEENRGKLKPKRDRPIEEKESNRWADGIHIANSRLNDIPEKIHICDRESDIFSLISMPQPEGSFYIIRVAQNRQTTEGILLRDKLSQQPVSRKYEVTVLKNNGKQPRQATMELHYCTVELQPPNPKMRAKSIIPLQPKSVTVIQATEINPPSSKDKVEWILYTTLPVENTNQALLCLEYYSYRWKIERYFYVLKQGTILESLQLRTAGRLVMALATLSLVAFRIMWLNYYSRESPNEPCDKELTGSEWKALYCICHRTQSAPLKPPTLREAIKMIAGLGGFLGRKSDGEPGLKTLWRGMLRLGDIAMAYDILKKRPVFSTNENSG